MLCVLLSLLATACVDIPSPQARSQAAERLAAASNWQRLRLPTSQFVLAAYAPLNIPATDTLTIYIEGDGLAWITPSLVSPDPTPVKPIALELALRQPQGAAAYLARPCQFVEAADAHGCAEKYWTTQRFSGEMVDAAGQAIAKLKRRFHARELVLVGYSGGGAIAALVAARRKDVSLLVTVAGNLDHRAWTQRHHISPLDGSLNPADEWKALLGVPQIHLVGGRDTVIDRSDTASYQSRFPENRRPAMQVIEDFDHACCWVERWPELYTQSVAGSRH
ncbi:MAG: alpha/beta hydrolase [Nitrosomonadales bacterium]|nr:alpha/beta hydrolase [Nitrosomonadales bacterium]